MSSGGFPADYVPVPVSVTLTDVQWAEVCALLGAVIGLQRTGMSEGLQTALALEYRAASIVDAQETIERTVMEEYIRDIVRGLIPPE
jgi:hypothetical protein